MALLYPIRIFLSYKNDAGQGLALNDFIEYAYVAEPDLLEEDEDYIPHRGYDEDYEDEWDEDYDLEGIANYEEE